MILTSQYRLFDAIEDFAGSVDIPAEQSTRTFSQDNFALSAEQINVNFEGLTFSTNSRDNFDNGRISTTAANTIPMDSIASIIIPSSLRDETSRELTRLVFSVFSDDTLFQPRVDLVRFQDFEVGSVFLSATPYRDTINDNLQSFTVSNLSDTVTIQFQKAMVCIYVHAHVYVHILTYTLLLLSSLVHLLSAYFGTSL